MTTKTKIVSGVVGLIAVIVLFLIGKSFGGTYVTNTTVGSAAGTTFSSAKLAQANISPLTSSATSSSILNTDDSDRIVLDGYASCSGISTSQVPNTGAGLASAGWLLSAATTSTANPSTVTNPTSNYAMNISIATTTASDAFTATSTYTQVFNRRWASGAYMTFFFNATNTAACTAGLHYIGS